MVRHNPGSCVFTPDRFFAGSLAVVHTPVVAVAAADNSLDTVWFIKITKEMRTDLESVKDKYGNTGLAESVVYPCVQVKYTKKGHLITSEEYLTIINYFEVNNLRMI